MAKREETQKEKSVHRKAISEMLKLIIASFGLIAALAWNEVAQEFVNDYIKPVFGKQSGFISLLIYAVLITIFVVIVTYFLSRFLKED